MLSIVCMVLLLVADSVATRHQRPGTCTRDVPGNDELNQPRITQLKARSSTESPTHSEVAFMATCSQEQELLLHETIIYDRVITNIGKAYNAFTGRFHCPTSGTYLFNFNVMAGYDTDYVEARLAVNGDPIVLALSTREGSPWDMGTTNAIIQLREGDYVNVAIQGPEGVSTVWGNSYNTFSGYLLRASE